MMAEIVLVARPGMVAMGMRDHCPVNGFPRVDVKSSLWAIQSFIGKFNEGHAEIKQMSFRFVRLTGPVIIFQERVISPCYFLLSCYSFEM